MITAWSQQIVLSSQRVGLVCKCSRHKLLKYPLHISSYILFAKHSFIYIYTHTQRKNFLHDEDTSEEAKTLPLAILNILNTNIHIKQHLFTTIYTIIYTICLFLFSFGMTVCCVSSFYRSFAHVDQFRLHFKQQCEQLYKKNWIWALRLAVWT